MDTAVLLVRLALAGVFAFAGVAKLRDLETFRNTLRDFGLRERAVPAVGVIVPIAEMSIAATLVPAATATWGAAGAAALLAALTTTVLATLAQGRRPDCGCFGLVASRPIGTTTVVRNVVPLVAALFVFVA